jgi:soluble cytochrome b562
VLFSAENSPNNTILFPKVENTNKHQKHTGRMRPGTLAYRVTKAAVAVGAFGAVGAGYNSMVSQRATAFDTMRKAMEEQQKIVPAMDIAAINWGSSVTTLHGLLNLTREVDGTLPVLTDAQLKQVKESMKALCSPWQTAPKLRFWTPLHDVRWALCCPVALSAHAAFRCRLGFFDAVGFLLLTSGAGNVPRHCVCLCS